MSYYIANNDVSLIKLNKPPIYCKLFQSNIIQTNTIIALNWKKKTNWQQSNMIGYIDSKCHMILATL